MYRCQALVNRPLPPANEEFQLTKHSTCTSPRKFGLLPEPKPKRPRFECNAAQESVIYGEQRDIGTIINENIMLLAQVAKRSENIRTAAFEPNCNFGFGMTFAQRRKHGEIQIDRKEELTELLEKLRKIGAKKSAINGKSEKCAKMDVENMKNKHKLETEQLKKELSKSQSLLESTKNELEKQRKRSYLRKQRKKAKMEKKIEKKKQKKKSGAFLRMQPSFSGTGEIANGSFSSDLEAKFKRRYSQLEEKLQRLEGQAEKFQKCQGNYEKLIEENRKLESAKREVQLKNEDNMKEIEKWRNSNKGLENLNIGLSQENNRLMKKMAEMETFQQNAQCMKRNVSGLLTELYEILCSKDKLIVNKQGQLAQLIQSMDTINSIVHGRK